MYFAKKWRVFKTLVYVTLTESLNILVVVEYQNIANCIKCLTSKTMDSFLAIWPLSSTLIGIIALNYE
jgi:hypothetical protein